MEYSESEEEHGGDVGHDSVFVGAGGVTLAEEEDTGDACSAWSNTDCEESNAGDNFCSFRW